MGASYILLLTAFYVDNRKNLPLRRELPQIAFWFLPAVIGSPITLYVVWTHPPGQSEPVGGAMLGLVRHGVRRSFCGAAIQRVEVSKWVMNDRFGVSAPCPLFPRKMG
jgi:hypothetical protein